MEKVKYNTGDRVLFHCKETLIDFEGLPEDFANKIGNRYGNITGIIIHGDTCLYTIKMDDLVFVCSDFWFARIESQQPISEEHLIKPEPESRKNDRQDEKEMWELLPFETIEEAVKVFTFGAKKYGINTWQNLPNGFERYRAAFLRHMVAHLKGEVLDRESGLLHLSHCLWNSIAMLHVYMRDHKDTIDFADIHIKASEAYFKKQKDNIAKGGIDKVLDAFSKRQEQEAEQQRTWK